MERNHSIDFFKFFALFFVVCIHTGPFRNVHTELFNGDIISSMINIFARFAVPYFFAVSGYLFGQKLISSRNQISYFKRYLTKLWKLYIVWLIFYLLYNISLKVFQSYKQGLNIKHVIIEYLHTTITLRKLYYGIDSSSSFHLWYLLALIWSIIILFIFIKINKVKILLIISLIFNLIGLFGQSYSFLFTLHIQTRDALFFGLFYTTLGYCFNHIKVNKRPKLYLALSCIFALLQLFEGFILIKVFERPLGNYYISTIPLIAFLLSVILTKNNLGRGSIFEKIGKTAVGVYIIHPLFLDLVGKFMIFSHTEFLSKNFIWNLLYPPFIFIVSYFTYAFLQVIKKKSKRVLVIQDTNQYTLSAFFTYFSYRRQTL
ncbi:acyltransferase [Priestia abyssalis]|uniref:acyltransferase n=1 Tax=Priestia abyssalis TaxID=1221450 RepID=UPI0038B5C730